MRKDDSLKGRSDGAQLKPTSPTKLSVCVFGIQARMDVGWRISKTSKFEQERNQNENQKKRLKSVGIKKKKTMGLSVSEGRIWLQIQDARREREGGTTGTGLTFFGPFGLSNSASSRKRGRIENREQRRPKLCLINKLR
jgi:hypothetical protein